MQEKAQLRVNLKNKLCRKNFVSIQVLAINNIKMLREFLVFFAIGLMAIYSYAQVPHDCTQQNIYEPMGDEFAEFYHICINDQGQAIKKDCPEGLLFILDLKGCSYKLPLKEDLVPECPTEDVKLPDYTDCTKCYICTGGEATVSDPCEPNYNFFLSQFVPDYSCEAEKNGRPDCKNQKVLYGTKYLIDVNDCQSYYRCENGIRIKETCPTGMLFDSVTRMCRYETEVQCSPTIPPSGPNTNDICKGKTSQFVADPNYCKAYYYCINDTTPYWSFCPDNKYFNNGLCVTSRPDTCTCEDVDYSGQTTVYVPHSDKSKFYICEEGFKGVEQFCPSGYVFDLEEESCVRQ